MDILVQRTHDEVFVSLSGRLDGISCRDFDAAAEAFLDRAGLNVEIEVTDLEYVSSAGLASLIKLSKRLAAHGGSLSFAGVRGEVRKVFDIAGFGGLFDLGAECFEKPTAPLRKTLTDAPEQEALSLPATPGSLDFFKSFLSSFVRRSSFSPELLSSAELVLEEVFLNIAVHAYQGGKGDVQLICRREGPQLCIEFRDQAPAFNPLEQAAPNLREGIEERSIGGLGIYLVRNIAQRVEYGRQHGENIFRIWIGPSA